MPVASDRLLEVALEAIAKLKSRVDGLPLPQKGEKGDKGDTGPQGPQGEKGERGEQGPKGDTGAQGEKGPQGEPGPKGEKGETGPKGDTGDRGPQGFAGRDGRDGQDGKDGAVGPAGPAGQDGTDGRDGRGVEKTEIKGTDLWITYTDGQEINLGRVVGEDGVTQTVVRNRKAGEGGGVAPPPPSGGDVSYLNLVSPTPLLAYKVLTTNALGQAIYADAGTLAHADQVVGVGLNAGTTIRVAEFGEVVNNGWNWTAGQALFLGLNGDIVTTPRLGVFNIQIGYAKTATSIIVKLGRSIILG